MTLVTLVTLKTSSHGDAAAPTPDSFVHFVPGVSCGDGSVMLMVSEKLDPLGGNVVRISDRIVGVREDGIWGIWLHCLRFQTFVIKYSKVPDYVY